MKSSSSGTGMNTAQHQVIVCIPLALVGVVGFLLGLSIALTAILVFPFGGVTLCFFAGGIAISFWGGHVLLLETPGITISGGNP
jgi:hypothetical protein